VHLKVDANDTIEDRVKQVVAPRGGEPANALRGGKEVPDDPPIAIEEDVQRLSGRHQVAREVEFDRHAVDRREGSAEVYRNRYGVAVDQLETADARQRIEDDNRLGRTSLACDAEQQRNTTPEYMAEHQAPPQRAPPSIASLSRLPIGVRLLVLDEETKCYVESALAGMH